jgi:hypothetical protein
VPCHESWTNRFRVFAERTLLSVEETKSKEYTNVHTGRQAITRCWELKELVPKDKTEPAPTNPDEFPDATNTGREWQVKTTILETYKHLGETALVEQEISFHDFEDLEKNFAKQCVVLWRRRADGKTFEANEAAKWVIENAGVEKWGRGGTSCKSNQIAFSTESSCPSEQGRKFVMAMYSAD